MGGHLANSTLLRPRASEWRGQVLGKLAGGAASSAGRWPATGLHNLTTLQPKTNLMLINIFVPEKDKK